MTSPPDIRRPGAVDAAWLTAVLQQGGVDAVVKGFTAANVGTGQIGESVRFELAYARRGDDAPASLVGKFPSSGEESRATGVALGNYIREVRFYQQLAPTALIHTPRCYFTGVDEATSEFVLMMEDLAPAEQGDQLCGVTLDQARLAVIEAAKLHASHWGDEGLDELPWVSNTKAAPPSAANDGAVAALWQGFKQRYGPRMQPHWTDAGERLTSRFAAIAQQHDGPRCLTHNDYRPDNMMFGGPRGGYPLTVLDWQSFAYGAGPTDVAYFLAGPSARHSPGARAGVPGALPRHAHRARRQRLRHGRPQAPLRPGRLPAVPDRLLRRHDRHPDRPRRCDVPADDQRRIRPHARSRRAGNVVRLPVASRAFR